MVTTGTAEYKFIEFALIECERNLNTLIEEMESFVALPLTAFADKENEYRDWLLTDAFLV